MHFSCLLFLSLTDFKALFSQGTEFEGETVVGQQLVRLILPKQSATGTNEALVLEADQVGLLVVQQTHIELGLTLPLLRVFPSGFGGRGGRDSDIGRLFSE